MSASAPAVRMVRRRFLNPHPFPYTWMTDEGVVRHPGGEVVEVLVPEGSIYSSLVEVLPDPPKPAAAETKEA